MLPIIDELSRKLWLPYLRWIWLLPRWGQSEPLRRPVTWWVSTASTTRTLSHSQKH